MDLESLPPEPDPTAPVSDSPPAAAVRARRRRPMLLAGVGAGLALAIGSFAVGTALANGGSPTVRLSNAAANGASATTTPGGHGGFDWFRRLGASGKVTSVGPNSFVVGGRAGPVTVQTNASTTYSMEATGQVSDAKVGSHVLVHGAPGANNTLAAQQIVLLPTGKAPAAPGSAENPTAPMPGGGLARRRVLRNLPGLAVGTVTSNNAGALTITTMANTKVTVTTTAKTTVVERVTATFDKIKVGDFVVASAAPSTGGTVPSVPPASIIAAHVEIVPAALASSAQGLGAFGFPLRPLGGRMGHRSAPGTGPGSGARINGSEPAGPPSPPSTAATTSI